MFGEPRLRPIDRPTERARLAATANAERADTRAAQRFAWARAAAMAAQMQGGSFLHRLRTLQTTGLAPEGLMPSEVQLRRLKERWQRGERSVGDYLDRPRAGRPPLHRAAPKMKIFRQEILKARAASPGAANQVLEQVVATRGWGAPSPSTTRRIVADIGFHAMVAARHGSRAAELDATPVGHIPREYTHFRWNVDETQLPIWAKFFCPELKAYRSFRPWLIVVRDHASSVVVGWYVVNPVGNVRPDVTPTLGYSQFDVMAALLTAASRDLAPPSCQPFAGAMPTRIRWDNHSTHKALEEQWREENKSGPDIEYSPPRRPINNGAAERTIGVLKHLFRSCPWHIATIHPADVENFEVRTSPGRARTVQAAAGTGRLPRHEILLPDALPDYDTVVRIVDTAVATYNDSRYRKSRLTRADEFRRLKRHAQRSGDDFIRLLPPQTASVTREGVPCAHRDGRVLVAADNPKEHFSAQIPQVVTYHLDPGARGAWARTQDRLVYLRRVDHPMTDAERRAFVIDQARRARAASDEAAAMAEEDGVLDATHQAVGGSRTENRPADDDVLYVPPQPHSPADDVDALEITREELHQDALLEQWLRRA